jgi:hypothetical protein
MVSRAQAPTRRNEVAIIPTATRSAHERTSLKLVAPPFVNRALGVPPVLNASDHTVDFVCGHCEALLMHGEHDQVHNVTIHCLVCGSYNATNE